MGLSVSANSSAFEQLARATAMVAANPSDTEAIAGAYTLAGTAMTGVDTLRETLAIQASSPDAVTTPNTAKIDAVDTLCHRPEGRRADASGGGTRPSWRRCSR